MAVRGKEPAVTNTNQPVDASRIRLPGNIHVAGWSMSPREAAAFIKSLGKTLLTFYGYSGLEYEDKRRMLVIARQVLSDYSPKTTLVNIGATSVGIGAIYPLAKSMGFTTAGIVSTRALEYPDDISDVVDHICFIADEQWGGKLPNSNELSPTSKAMVECSDVLVGIGGGAVSLDEMLAGHEQGKQVLYFPAEMNHERASRQAAKKGLPPPTSFKGDAHDTLVGLKRSDLKERLNKLKGT